MAKPLLSVRNIKVSYTQGKQEIKILDGISFDVNTYEFFSIVGPSGCGKSTLIRIIAGLQKPTSGTVIYKGKEVTEPPGDISMIFQNFALFPWKTALENVILALENKGMSKEEMIKEGMEAIKEVNLQGFESAYPAELSGGMKQRVGVARAIVSDPDLLLMDEPFSSLDDLTAEQLRWEVHRIVKDKRLPIKAVIMVSHNVEEIVELSDRIIVLSKPPSRIIDTITVDLPYPRSRGSRAFLKVTGRIYEDLYAGEK